MALLNSGDSMALLAKELNPFSISPIKFCQIATGSLLLSAIGVPRIDDECLASFGHTTLLRQGGQRRGVDLTALLPLATLLRRAKPCHRVLITVPFRGTTR